MDNALFSGPVLVLGFGNPARGDDGAGPAVIEMLSGGGSPAGVELLVAAQLVPEFCERWATAALVVLVDADARQAPGVITRYRVRPATKRDGGHRWTAATLGTLAVELHGRCAPIVAYTIGGADFSVTAPWEFTLSLPVRAAIERLARRLTRRLARSQARWLISPG
jgi:hydrogenase maturation protease